MAKELLLHQGKYHQGASCSSTVPLVGSRDHSDTLMVVTIFISRYSPQIPSLKEADGETFPFVGSAASRAARLLR